MTRSQEKERREKRANEHHEGFCHRLEFMQLIIGYVFFFFPDIVKAYLFESFDIYLKEKETVLQMA